MLSLPDHYKAMFLGSETRETMEAACPICYFPPTFRSGSIRPERSRSSADELCHFHCSSLFRCLHHGGVCVGVQRLCCSVLRSFVDWLEGSHFLSLSDELQHLAMRLGAQDSRVFIAQAA